jgi:hypothetical protein
VIAKHRSIVDGMVDKDTDEAMLDFILSVEKKPDISKPTRHPPGIRSVRVTLLRPRSKGVCGIRKEKATAICAQNHMPLREAPGLAGGACGAPADA